jgi:hypothetical protein
MAAISVITKMIEVVHPGNTTQYYRLPVEYGVCTLTPKFEVLFFYKTHVIFCIGILSLYAYST